METIHPAVVHFPIALLLTAVAFDLAALIFGRAQMHRLALWNLCLGTVGAALAVLTGLQAEAVAKHSFEIWQVLGLHKRLAIASLILGLAAAAPRLWKRDRLSRRARTVTMAVMLAMAATLGIAGYLGGRLVYEFGVGGRFGT